MNPETPQSDTPRTDLKPCPFCGSAPLPHETIPGAIHPMNECILSCMLLSEFKETPWNTRPIERQNAELLAALRKIADLRDGEARLFEGGCQEIARAAITKAESNG